MEDDAAAAAAVSKVFGDDDLLAEILLRVGFPTTLVRAASVCKRWLHHASDKAFLRRFRKLNPPRLLGFYVEGQGSPRFVPLLPQPPELAAAVRIAGGYSFGASTDRVRPLNCRNGSLFTELRCSRIRSGVGLRLHSPLCPERATTAINPPVSPYQHLHYHYVHYLAHLRVVACQQHPNHYLDHLRGIGQILSREEKDGGSSYFYALLENPGNEDIMSPTNLRALVYMLKDGVWCMHASTTTKIPPWKQLQAALVDNKIYMTTSIGITVFDLTTSSFSRVQLPELVDSMISQADDDASSVYLIGLNELQLRIWLYDGDSWSIVDTICLHEMWENMRMSDCRIKDADTSLLRLNHVGDNAKFVLLQMGRFVLYLDIRCRTLCTLYEMSQDDPIVDISIQPFMMIWPPTFPALKCDPIRNVT